MLRSVPLPVGFDPLEAPTAPQAGSDAGVGLDTYPCKFCGHCETPDECAWSRQCPTCNAPAGKISTVTMCKTPTGAPTSLHAERWLA